MKGDIWHDPLFLSALKKGGAGGTASGDIVTFTAPKAAPLKALTLSIDPVQAGTGDPSPDNVRPISGWSAANVWRTGKNLFDPYAVSLSSTSPITATRDGGKIVFNGSNTSATYFNITKPVWMHKQNPSAVIVKTSGNFNGMLQLQRFDRSGNNIGGVTNIQITSGTDAYLANGLNTYYPADYFKGYISLYGNQTFENAWIEICFLLGSHTSTDDFVSWDGTTIPVTWSEAGTVYGGVWDVIGGVLRVTHAEVDLGTLTWTKIKTSGDHWRFWAMLNTMRLSGQMISSQYRQISATEQYIGAQGIANQSSGSNVIAMVSDERYADAVAFKAAMSGVQLVYELATPLEYPLTPQQLDTLAGTNVVWGDSGAVSLEYAGGGVSKDMMLAAILHEARQ